MNLEIIILNEASQTEKYILCGNTYVESKKIIQINLYANRNRLTDIENKIMDSKREMGEGNYGINIQSIIHKIDIQHGFTVHSTWICIQYVKIIHNGK